MSTRTLQITNNAELLSYMINKVPELQELDLPVQGEGTKHYGELIMNEDRYKNAFINTINLIGLTLIKRNEWENPWESFANRGTLKYGQQIREMIQDLAKVFDYNEEYNNKTKFLDSFVPDVLTYVHEVNFQKVYATTINEAELLMAFDSEDGLLDFIADTVGNLYETFKYDKFQVDKYQLARRFLQGTVTTVQIEDFDNLTPRQILTKMKAYSNKMTFRKPFYNPAGIRKATPHAKQITMLDTDGEAEYTTDVLAQSYFRNEAELKTNLALIDGYNEFDEARLTELLGDDFVPFTSDEKEQLANVVGNILSDKWFMDFYKALDNGNSDGKKQIEFINPTTLERNIFLHVHMALSTSPFENAIVFVKNTPKINSVTVSPLAVTTSAGQQVQLNASVSADGMANKSVLWSVDDTSEELGVKVNQKGLVSIPSNYEVPTGTQGVYTIEIKTALADDEVLTIDDVEYTCDISSDDTAVKQATSIKTLLESDETVNARYTITRTNAVLTFTEKTGHYGEGKPVVDDSDLTTGVVEEKVTTQGVSPNIIVTATSIYDTTKTGSATITVA